MPTLTSDARFLGLDLRTLGRELRHAWADALQSPLLSWLTPEATVLLLQADGTTSLWWGDRRQENAPASRQERFTALQLPEDLLLRRSFVLPPMDVADTAGAVALQAQAISPFAASDLVSGWSGATGTRGGQQIDIVLASRRQVAQYLQAQAPSAGAAAPEVWAVQPTGAPIVLAGYGEAARQRHAAQGRRLRYGLLALALALLGAMALTPTLQLRARAIEAVQAYDGVVRRTPALVHEREQLLQTVEKLNTLSELLAGRIEPLRVLDRLTQVLPDDTALQSFTLKGNKVTLSGLTGNSSAVMQVLGQQPGMRDVRAPSAATRTGGADSKENFVVEFTLDPQEFGVAMVPPPAPLSPPAPAPPAEPSPVSALAPAAAAPATAKAPPPQASAAAGDRVPAFGGSAPVFGGSAPQPAAAPAQSSLVRKGTP